MAGKNTKNPLLTGASISFPFENFTNSALLVPVSPQNEPTLLPEEIEADSFLGQEPPSSISSKHFSKPQFPDPARTPDLHPLPPSLSSIPVFTQSYTGSTSPAKPTPIYADALNPQFNRTLTFEPLQSHNNDSYFYPNREASPGTNLIQPPPTQPPLSQPPPTQTTPLFFSNQNSSYATPTIFTPTLTTAPVLLNPSPSVPSNHTPSPITSISPAPQSIFNYFSTLEPSQQSNAPPVQLFSPSVTTPSAPPLQPFPPSIPAQVPLPPQTSEANVPPPLGGPHNSYRLSNIKRPTYTRPPELSVMPMAAMPSPVPPPVAPAPASTTLFTPCNVDSTVPASTTLFTPCNVDSSVPASTTLFTPSNVDSTVPAPIPVSTLFPSSMPATTPASTILPSSVPTTTPASTILPSSVPTTTSASTILPPSVPPTIQILPLSTSTPAPTLPPSAPATVSVSAAPAMPYRPPQSQSPNTPSVLPPSFANLAQGTSYRPVYCHWFFKKVVEGKVLWFPFSMNDSLALEQAFTSPTISPDTKVATDGGRYDVEVLRRRRTAVYWEEDPGEVRRCSWFVKGSMDVRFIPYEENVATMLEEEYRIAATTNEWNRHVPLPDGETIVIHSPNAIAHHSRSASPDVWGNSPQMQQKPRVVKRGMDEFDISEGEPENVDHLLFLVHGIGKFCDLKFRPVTEVVDDFRSVSLQLLQSHFKSAVEAGQASRVEVLPVSWHQALHNADIDTRLNNITLRSIPRLRHFTNDTLLDILFYTSPVFCETIVQAVGNELNRLYNLFLSRNPSYRGGVSLGGHSLGSLILFDMLCNQVPVASPSPHEQPSTPTSESQDMSGEEEVKSLGCMKTQKARLSRTVSYLTIGNAGTGQPFISYPQLVFRPKAFFALGSPIGMFVTVRGIESLGEDFALPTCPMFFNIFHPFDPVAYRIESLITSDFAKYSPVLIAHHKGRKRMHLELKDTLEHVGTALKQKLIESVRNTWNTVYQLAMFHRSDDQAIEQEVNKVLESEMMQSCGDACRSDTPDACPEPDVKMGQLNGGRRVDYVLQEAPLESFNEYLFALSSHVCYWESEDTMLMMLKEIYGTMDVSPDTQVVQQILPYEEPGGAGHYSGGMNPTAQPSDNISAGPPPVSGFFRNPK